MAVAQNSLAMTANMTMLGRRGEREERLAASQLLGRQTLKPVRYTNFPNPRSPGASFYAPHLQPGYVANQRPVTRTVADYNNHTTHPMGYRFAPRPLSQSAMDSYEDGAKGFPVAPHRVGLGTTYPAAHMRQAWTTGTPTYRHVRRRAYDAPANGQLWQGDSFYRPLSTVELEAQNAMQYRQFQQGKFQNRGQW